MNEQQNRNEIIKAVLLSFKITTYGFEEMRGATVTLYKFRPQIGVRISKIRNLKDELASALGVPSVRIIAPMEDGSVGIEVPNSERKIIPVDDIFNSLTFQNSDMELPVAIGRTVTNEVFVSDLAEMPHLLVAGATGQGKSVGLNVLIMSLLKKKSPEELKLVLIDPKKVELSIYSSLQSSYLACPVITETEEAERKLEAICTLMDERYELLSSVGVRNIKEYNALSIVEPIPYIVTIIDEYGDLIMTADTKIEKAICRIAQKARAVGIHMIIATQRPDTKIVTGNIKANFPARIAFRTTTGIDSRVVLDQVGAEKLSGKGDMIFFNANGTTRMQCAYASTEDVMTTCSAVKEKYAEYDNKFFKEKETEPVLHIVRLSEPIHRFTKAVAMVVADQTEVTETFVRLKMVMDFMETRIVFNQLIQLGILEGADSPTYIPRSGRHHVLMHDKDEISRLIDKFS